MQTLLNKTALLPEKAHAWKQKFTARTQELMTALSIWAWFWYPLPKLPHLYYFLQQQAWRETDEANLEASRRLPCIDSEYLTIYEVLTTVVGRLYTPGIILELWSSVGEGGSSLHIYDLWCIHSSLVRMFKLWKHYHPNRIRISLWKIHWKVAVVIPRWR